MLSFDETVFRTYVESYIRNSNNIAPETTPETLTNFKLIVLLGEFIEQQDVLVRDDVESNALIDDNSGKYC